MLNSRTFSLAASIALLGVSGLSMVACAAQTDDAEVEVVESDVTASASALTSGGPTYYVVTRRDTRRCASPMCGGHFVKAVNAELDTKHAGKTLCADGTWQKECYVGAISYVSFGHNGRSQAAFDTEFKSGNALVAGELAVGTTEQGIEVATLTAREAWSARSTAAAVGAFATLTLPDARCLPSDKSCARGYRDLLNDSAGPTAVQNVEYVGFNKADKAEAEAAGHKGGRGLLVAGNVTKSNAVKTLKVTQFYTRVDAVVGAVGDLCGTRGANECASDLYCAFPAGTHCGAADQGGTCAAPSKLFCTEQYQPVCGCDGKTYGNACSARQAGVSIDFDGECTPPAAQLGESCGGNRRGGPVTCAEGLFCDYTLDAICGFADASGTCKTTPEVCTREFNPVCGCDGVTYPTACVANSKGVAVQAKGECPAAPAN